MPNSLNASVSLFVLNCEMYSISFCCVLLTFFGIVTSGNSSSLSISGTYCDGTGWVAYRDEKCYKLIKKWATRDEAKDVCTQEESDGSIPQLVTIKSAAEQTYLTEFVFDTSAVRFNVWIGANRITGSNNFVWDDGSHLGPYTNWADASPTEVLERKCVVMQSKLMKGIKDLRSLNGKWRDAICDSVNYVICEKPPNWSFSKLQQTLLSQRKELDETKSVLNDTRNELTSELVKITNELTHTKQNPVPIGFIYVQLSGQPEPSTLWSTVQWQEVTRDYAGLFFRAEGGDAAQFGTVQENNAPRVTEVRFQKFDSNQGGLWSNTKLNVGGWSSGIGVFSGAWNDNYLYSHQFLQSGGEVRPRNMAIRVWKRIS